MHAYRIGYIFTVSFLTLLAVVCLTLGNMPAPKGPKPPEYPENDYSYITQQEATPLQTLDLVINSLSPTPTPIDIIATPTPYQGAYTSPYRDPYIDPYYQRQNEYQQKLKKYQEDKKQYEKDQKAFIKDEIIPYTKNMFVTWLVLLVTIEAAGLLLMKFGVEFLGSALTFTGVWAILVGPVGGMLWFGSHMISRFSTAVEEPFSIDPVLQAVGITALVGVIILGILPSLLTRIGIVKFVPPQS